MGADDGSLTYIENIGTPTAPAFVQRIGSANPFDDIDVGSHSAPRRRPRRRRRSGPRSGRIGWRAQLHREHRGHLRRRRSCKGPKREPFDGIDARDSAPALGISTATATWTSYWAKIMCSTGTVTEMTWWAGSHTSRTLGHPRRRRLCKGSEARTPFDGIDVNIYRPTLGDIDNDGDLDLVVGGDDVIVVGSNSDGTTWRTLGRLRRRRSCKGPEARTPSTASTLVDTARAVDGAATWTVTGSSYFADRLTLVENIGTSTALTFVQRTGSANPFDGIGYVGGEPPPRSETSTATATWTS